MRHSFREQQESKIGRSMATRSRHDQHECRRLRHRLACRRLRRRCECRRRHRRRECRRYGHCSRDRRWRANRQTSKWGGDGDRLPHSVRPKESRLRTNKKERKTHSCRRLVPDPEE